MGARSVATHHGPTGRDSAKQVRAKIRPCQSKTPAKNNSGPAFDRPQPEPLLGPLSSKFDPTPKFLRPITELLGQKCPSTYYT